MILHGYWRSGASYRVRIGLNLKGLAYEQAPVELRKGEQRSEAYLALNPQGMVPALEYDGRVLTQSLAILEWLDETHPEPALLPKAADDRAAVRAMTTVIACDIHPLNNLRVLKAVGVLGADQIEWTQGWIRPGFDALETLVERYGGDWAFGDQPGLTDCFLIPQIYSARRFELDMAAWPRLAAIDGRAADHPAFTAAHPDRQPDAD